MNTKQYTYQEVKFKLEQWCVYQDRCSFEVHDKISSYLLSEEETDKLIQELTKNRFLDNKRFVESYVLGKFRIKNWGKIKIKHHLIQKRIEKMLISEGLDLIDEEDYENTIEKLILKKIKELKSNLSDYEKKTKVISNLSSKGFELEKIINCYQKLNFV